LSSFPPTACGIATFSNALAKGLAANGATVEVVRCGEGPATEDARVRANFGDGGAVAARAAVEALNRTDVAILQHEYGLFGANDGEAVLGVIEHLDVPVIVVAHTVLQSPTSNQRRVLTQVCAEADAVVVMTAAARHRLIAGYGIESSRVALIPHGAAVGGDDASREDRVVGRAPKLLTWGLLGPGKGIEWAVEGLAMLGDLPIHPRYTVAGATHPKVRAREGEAYREMLIERATRVGVRQHVVFDDEYRDVDALTALIRSTDLVVLPYDSKDQVTSGVLVDAVAAGRPVVSTAFPHAVELLGSGAGLVVPQRDPVALAAAIRTVLCDHDLAASMAAEARRLAPSLSWSAVAAQYDAAASDMIGARDLLAS